MATQGAHPACVFLTLTVLVTAAATVLLCSAVLTDHWEVITFDKEQVMSITRNRNATHNVTWLWNDKVARVDIRVPATPDRERRSALWSYSRKSHFVRKRRSSTIQTSPPSTNTSSSSSSSSSSSTTRVVFLVPMYGGIWSLCVGLSEAEQTQIRDLGFPRTGCISYLAPPPATTTTQAAKGDSSSSSGGRGGGGGGGGSSSSSSGGPLSGAPTLKNDWVQRMQNLSISCALVCCILLGSAALVGVLGVFKRQTSAVLVTGVMYILAATFGLFCLAIMHFKRKTKRDCGVLDEQVQFSPEYSEARDFGTGWSLNLGWAGVATCLAAAALWLLLARIMRYNPISLT
ncbi:uncharacterized protein LOC143031358 [Oratosquilla oratoria]|uniref:uncharacterized protein LOC143031358 n=1 Tax=Oratosquilla oratoria TaxID=337810 RepID=UPI003F7689FB